MGLSGNLGECNNSSSIKIVSHRKVVELHYALHKETLGRLQPVLHRADSILRTIRADTDLYKRIGVHARLFASFGCSSENGSDS